MADIGEINAETMSDQHLLSKIKYHGIFVFLIPLLVAVLQVRVQGSIKSLFETHTINMYTFLLSTFIYCLALAAHMKCKLHHTSNSHDQSGHFDKLFGAAAIISGSLSSVALVSVLLPRLLGLIIFIALTIIVLIVVACKHPSFAKDTYNWLDQKLEPTFDWLHQKIGETYYSLNQKIKESYYWLNQMINETYNWLRQKIRDKLSCLTEEVPLPA